MEWVSSGRSRSCPESSYGLGSPSSAAAIDTVQPRTCVTGPASVGGRDRLRLFVGLRLPDEPLERLLAWQREHLPESPSVRIVPRGNLHVTLAFLGSCPATDVESIGAALRESAADAGPLLLNPSRYRETRSVGMIVFDDEEGRGARLAEAIWERLERLGVYERERREWLAHVTVVRFRQRPRLVPPPPDLGPLSPSEVALYHSVLQPSGARYEILESVALGGSTP
ncbi:MAG: RNA 2',3'-cyclic phosphodiesterase [Gaiellaceae bacterium]